jgi:hypothetical protein
MDRFTSISLVSLVGICLIAGCSRSASDQTATTAGTKPNAAVESNPSTAPVAHAAGDFLDAVLKGDTQRASARLTPQAMQRIISSGKQFAPPGLDTASFKITDVRTPSPDQAIVQCVLTDSSEGTPNSEEMCCLLRRVENDWRISGIAYGTTPDQPWTLSDFETGQNMVIPRQASTQGSVSPNPTQASRPSPPRTAQEPSLPGTAAPR